MANPIKIYKTLEEAYNALLKGFRSIKKRDPDIIENQMLKAEAEGKIKSQGDNISIFPQDSLLIYYFFSSYLSIYSLNNPTHTSFLSYNLTCFQVGYSKIVCV